MAALCFLRQNIIVTGRAIYKLVKDPLSLSLLDQADTAFGRCLSLNPNEFVSNAGDKWINLWSFEQNKVKKLGMFQARKKITVIQLLSVEEHHFVLFGDKTGDVNSININTALRGQFPKIQEQGIKEEEEDKQEEDASEKEFDSSAPARFLMGHMDSIVQLFLNEEHSLLYTLDKMNKIKVSAFPEVFNLEQVILPFIKKYQAQMYPLSGNRLLTHSLMEGMIKIFEAKTGEILQSIPTEEGCLSPILKSNEFCLQTQQSLLIYGLDEEGNLKQQGSLSREEAEKGGDSEMQKEIVHLGGEEYLEVRREEEGLIKLIKLRRDNN